MPGVKIGDGAVIGTRAVVTCDVEPDAIVASNPAKASRKRFGVRLIGPLQRMKWRDWPMDGLKVAMPLMTSGDIVALHRCWRVV